jgi:hypothetical protein
MSLLVFAVRVVAALQLLLWFGRNHWFYLDEFQILGADGLSHTATSTATTAIGSRCCASSTGLNFELWGSAPTYQVPAVLGHLVSAVLLRRCAGG